MDIDKNIKKKLKEEKLTELKIKYYKLELDKTALLAVDDNEGVKELVDRMESIKKAYEAINTL